MNKMRHTVAGRAALAALALLLAAFAVGGATSAQAPAEGARAVYPSVGGLDHFAANEQTILPGASVTLAVGYRHQVCLVSDTEARPGGVVRSAAEVEGLSWVIETVEGAATVEGPASLVHPDGATATSFGRETCVYWTSSAAGVQTVLLRDVGRVVADDGLYTESADGLAAPAPLTVRWVDTPAISLTSGGRAVTAPIERTLTFYGTDARGDHFRSGETVRVIVGVTAGALETANLAGMPVSFAVSGACGTVTVPGAIGIGVAGGVVAPGTTGEVQWGAAPLVVAIANTFCNSADAATTVAVTAGQASASFSVNWAWDGYTGVSVTDVGTEGTEKLVTFHTAAAREGTGPGWVCDSELQSRAVSFSLSGGSAFVAGGLQQTLLTLASRTGASIAADDALPPALASGLFRPTDSECRQSWTVRSPARAANLDLTISAAGFSLTRKLDFSTFEPETRTFARLDQPLVEGGSTFVEWTFADTPVEDASRGLEVTAVYYWVSSTQSWLSWFPGAEGLGVNTLTRVERNGIYAVFLAD